MSVTLLQLTANDPIIARDGRPFGVNQGRRMRGLPWPLPSVVAGSFRTALVKASSDTGFSGDVPERLKKIAVAGVFPVYDEELYLPAPGDALAEPTDDKKIKTVHRVVPSACPGGCDFPDGLPLQPVVLPKNVEDFKPIEPPAWWPLTKMVEWLTATEKVEYVPDWLTEKFLNQPIQQLRDHVQLDAELGASAEGLLFATSGLHVSHLPRHGAKANDRKIPFEERFAQITLSARVDFGDSDWQGTERLSWHPLGGERRLVHWASAGTQKLWECPGEVKERLANATRIRMVLATPAIFANGWKPGWLKNGLEGEFNGVKLKLKGVSNGRWKAVSGWSLAKTNDKGQLDPSGKPGPKAIRRMVPAGSVYFFEVENPGDAAPLAGQWLHSVSDEKQEQLDGFGLAVWGTW